LGRGAGWRRWGPVLVWLAVIWTVNSMPRSVYPASMGKSSSSDQGAHLALYVPLGFVLGRAFASGLTGRRAALVAVLVTVLVGGVLGALDEWHKLLIPGRHGEVPDWGLDVAAVAAGSLVALLFRTREEPKPSECSASRRRPWRRA
jgi:VanZ family protein